MAIVIPYVKQAWTDGVHDCDAARNTVHEDGIHSAHLQPAVRASASSVQGITSGVTTALLFPTERFDQAAGVADTQHDLVTNNGRFTCRYAGVYFIAANIEWSANPVNGFIAIRLNGTTQIGRVGIVGDLRQMNVTTLYSLAVNEYVEVIVQQSSGGTINVSSSANYSPEFMMVRVG